MTEIRTIVALGSSFASGPLIDPVENRSAMRSGRNFAHQVAQRLGATLIDRTSAGATTAHILDSEQVAHDGVRLPPQIESVLPDADVLLVTAGGNNLGLLPTIISAALRHGRRADLIESFGAKYLPEVPVVADEQVELVISDLVDIATAVRNRAGAARVVYVDYQTILSPATARLDLFADADLTALRALQESLASAFVTASQEAGADLVRASGISAEHAVGDVQPWVNALLADPASLGASFHPNLAGMTAVADAIEAALR